MSNIDVNKNVDVYSDKDINTNTNESVNKTGHKKILYRFILTTLLILWMIVIFSFSSQPAEESDGISRNIVTKIIIENYNGYNDLNPVKQVEFGDMMDFVVRKVAHFTEYAILGIIFYLNLVGYEVKNKKGIIFAIIITVIFVTLYASSDEVHQMYVSGRSGNVRDVVIDTSGSVFAMIIVALVNLKKKAKK